MRRDSPRYGSFPKRRKSRERPWNRASPAFGKLWEHAGKCRVDLKVKNTQKKKKGRSVQELLGIKTFTKYGLATTKGELLFYLVSPTNISVLSHTNIEIKIRHLMMVLSALPDIEIICTDSSECFDDNKA